MAPRSWACALSLGLALAAGAATAEPLPKDMADPRQDFAFADRGFVATRKDPQIRSSDGRVVWDLAAYDFLKGPAPATVNPSLWRQAQLLSRHGLYKVADGVWQVRGFDISNVTFIAGKTGWIVIDPLTTVEVARAALDLANEQLGARPVTAVIYTHSHVDHFGGARGVIDPAQAPQVIAPEGFLEHAVSENVIAGVAMSRRAAYQFGGLLAKDPVGQVTSGIGQGISQGTQSLVPPTVLIQRTGQELMVDGVRLQFQMTPGTEAPAEMNIYLPDRRILCMAENANVSMHNVLTPRGALVRDAKSWADELTQSLRLYGDKSDVMFTSHGWPRFGQEEVADFLAKHRDAYKYLHDQTVRLMNQGLTGPEIAERVALPPSLAREWYNRGYYGTMSFNSRAIYQRYMGWYDANPVHLAPYAPAEEAQRYVAAMGGATKVTALARKAAESGDDRWAAELLNRVVFADPQNQAVNDLLAASYERLGFAAEGALTRNMYLTGALELRRGVAAPAGGGGGAVELLRNTPTPMLLDLMAVRLDASKVGEGSAVIDLVFPERKERFRVAVRNGVLTYDPAAPSAGAELTATMPRAAFLAVAFGGVKPQAAAGQITTQGDAEALSKLVSWLDAPKPDFPIVTP